jgi:hypothetical protein
LNYLAPLDRDLRERLANVAVERFQLGQIGRGIGSVRRRVGGIGGDHGVADVCDIDLGVSNGLPGVRVD